MYSKILVPLDGSKLAEQVLPYVRLLAGAVKIPIELLGVIDLGGIAATTGSHRARYLGMLANDARRASESYLERVSVSIPGIAVTRSVETGNPEQIIIEKEATDKSALIAMATRGRSGVNRWLLGSVAEKVLRGAGNPGRTNTTSQNSMNSKPS